MNVLSDILCTNSPLILSSSYNGPLSSHDAHLTRPMSKQNIMLSNEKDLHLLETLSAMPNLVQTPNTTDVENGFFHAPESIHASLNLVNSNYPMHHETDPSNFVNDGFHNSIPSWFPKDLIKVSEHISAGCCEPTSNSSPLEELCPIVRNENLTMMQLGFPHEMTSQNNVINSMSSNCMPNNHPSMMSESQVYSSTDSLLMSTFTDIGSFPLPISKMNRSCDKYDQSNTRTYPANTTHNIINSVLPLDNNLDINQSDLHLSLANTIIDPRRLTHTVNSTMIADNQNVSHNVEALRDKRPHISLNQLDFLLDTHSPLHDMQIAPNNFSVNAVSGKQPCSDFSQESVIDTCSGTLNVMSCNNGSLSNLNIHPFSESQEIVDIGTLPQLSINSGLDTTHLSDVIDSAVEETKCLKCKYCTFLSLDRVEIRNHIKQVHSKSLSQPQTNSVFYSSNMLPPENYCNSALPVVTVEQSTENLLCSDSSKTFCCDLCVLNFDSMESYKTHTLTVHNCRNKLSVPDGAKTNDRNLENVLKKLPVTNTPVTNGNICHYGNASHQAMKETGHNNAAISNNDNTVKNNNVPESAKKNCGAKKSNNSEENVASLPRRMSSHKKAWQRKMKRELSSYICEFKGCNVRFHFLDNLEYHRKCHVAGTGKFACPECAVLFNHWGPAAGHLWRNHSTDMELHACDQCPFRTYSLSKLENYHKPIHQEKYAFRCDICDKSFKTTKQLRHHKVIHTKPSPSSLPKKFSCFICSRQFSTKKFLRVHLLVHNKQKSFLCNVCGYSASKRSTLKMHALQHTGEKPFACQECEFKTSDHNTLRRHKMKHSGEKPYKCPFCTYACIQSSTYKVHIKREHPGQEHNLMFSCTICSFRSVKQDNYIAHLADHEMEKVSRLDNNCNPVQQILDSPCHQESEVLPLVEAMDISLSHGERTMLLPTNKDKDSVHSYLSAYSRNESLFNH